MCLKEKYFIINYPHEDILLNKRWELISKCAHENKNMLANIGNSGKRNNDSLKKLIISSVLSALSIKYVKYFKTNSWRMRKLNFGYFTNNISIKTTQVKTVWKDWSDDKENAMESFLFWAEWCTQQLWEHHLPLNF